MELTKECIHCKQQKLLKRFSVDKSKKDGLCVYCKRCNSLLRTAWYKRRRLIRLGAKIEEKQCMK
jgi:NAD-dependent SIR2 family protein deacetylase